MVFLSNFSHMGELNVNLQREVILFLGRRIVSYLFCGKVSQQNHARRCRLHKSVVNTLCSLVLMTGI